MSCFIKEFILLFHLRIYFGVSRGTKIGFRFLKYEFAKQKKYFVGIKFSNAIKPCKKINMRNVFHVEQNIRQSTSKDLSFTKF